MAKTQDYTDKFKGFADKLNTEKVEIPMQKVVPIKASAKKVALDRDNSKPFSVWFPNETIKALKVKAANEECSLKDIINKAVDAYLAVQ